MPKRLLTFLLAKKLGVITLALLAALGGATVAVAVAVIISNVLNIGAPVLSDFQVRLEEVQNLPDEMRLGKTESGRFEIRNEQGSEHTNAFLMVQVSAPGHTLSDTMLDLVFKDPDTGDEKAVALTAEGDNLKGVLKSAWTIPVDYLAAADFDVTFNDGAPLASYSLATWVEEDAEAEPAPGPSQTVDVQATDDEVFVPETITINAGDTVRWNNTGTKPHSVTFADTSIASEDFLAEGATYEVTFGQAGTFSYQCIFHPPGMVGTIIVQP